MNYSEMSTDELNQAVADLEAALTIEMDEATRNRLSNQLAEAQEELSKRTKVEQRTQEQEEHIESIELPRDYDQLFNKEGLNDEFLFVGKQLVSQTWDMANEMIRSIESDFTGKIAELTAAHAEQMAQLQRKNEELQTLLDDTKRHFDVTAEQLNSFAAENVSLREANAQLAIEKRDAEAKRDAAVRAQEAAEQRLQELTKPAIKVTDKRAYRLTSSLPDTPIKSHRETALEQIGLTLPSLGGAPTGETFPADSDTSDRTVDEEGTTPADQPIPAVETFQTDVAGTVREGAEEDDAGAPKEVGGPIEALQAQIDALVGRVNEQETRVARLERVANPTEAVGL